MKYSNLENYCLPHLPNVVLLGRQNSGIDIGWASERVCHTINSFNSHSITVILALIFSSTEEQMKG